MTPVFCAIKRLGCFLFEKFIKPKSKNGDLKWKEFILNIFLLASITLLFVAFLAAIHNFIVLGDTYKGTSPVYVLIIFLSFITLLFFSRRGFVKSASHIFIGIYLLVISYGIYYFGIDQPQILLGFALLTIMVGVLVNSRFAFLTTLASTIILIAVGFLQIKGFYEIHNYWKQEPNIKIEDPIIFSITLIIITISSWLYNKEIEKSLKRAEESEAELKKERDSLEVIVEERTKQLKETQTEKISQLYRFAEFGKLSSGLFHDLVNPLNAVSLNIERIKNENGNNIKNEMMTHIDKAISATKKMADFVDVVRKQLSRQEKNTSFSLKEEIDYVVDALSYKARKANVNIYFSLKNNSKMFGDAIKFNQIILNLVANAIDSYSSIKETKKDVEKNVFITLEEEKGNIILSIKDNGIGISQENLQKIFEPFFTTKTAEQGIGIGLSITKRLVEKNFGGSIEIKSEEGKGSTFTVKLLNKNEHERIN